MQPRAKQALTTVGLTARVLVAAALVVALALVLQSGGLPRFGSEDLLGDLLADESAVLLLPESVPADFLLWDVQLLRTGPSEAVDVATSMYVADADGVIVSICVGSDAALVSSSCVGEGTQVLRAGVLVTVVVECVSEVCTGFDEQEWLSGFGSDPPAVSDIKRI